MLLDADLERLAPAVRGVVRGSRATAAAPGRARARRGRAARARAAGAAPGGGPGARLRDRREPTPPGGRSDRPPRARMADGGGCRAPFGAASRAGRPPCGEAVAIPRKLHDWLCCGGTEALRVVTLYCL